MWIPPVVKEYKLPFELREYQHKAISFCCLDKRSGLFADVGLGKTVMGTLIAFHHVYEGNADKIIVLCPPILIGQWYRWFQQIEYLNPGITVCAYKGTPKKRASLNLDADVLIMSIQIFKNDFDRLYQHHKRKKPFLIVDEAAAVRRPQTQNFRKVRDFSRNRGLLLMTGTPLNSPLHAYGYLKLLRPSIYRSLAQFRTIHVAKEDFWGNAIEFKNLDLLKTHLDSCSIILHAEDCLDLPEIVYDVVCYDLSKKHMKLYRTLVEERLLVLKDKVIDATEAQRLYHASQRIIMSPQAYSDEPIQPAGFEVIDSMLEEMEGEKLIIFANYRQTNRSIYRYVVDKGYNAVLCYGDTPSSRQQENLQRFIADPTCRVLVANPGSIGVGVDGLQDVSRAVLFMELPLTSDAFKQAVGRVHRSGQKRSCFIRMAVANGTIQQMLRKRVVQKDDLVQQVIASPKKLRDALYGRLTD